MGKTQTSDSFVARLWLESGTNGDQMWRGHIRHVQGDEEAYFQDLERMSDFMEQLSNIPVPRSWCGKMEKTSSRTDGNDK